MGKRSPSCPVLLVGAGHRSCLCGPPPSAGWLTRSKSSSGPLPHSCAHGGAPRQFTRRGGKAGGQQADAGRASVSPMHPPCHPHPPPGKKGWTYPQSCPSVERPPPSLSFSGVGPIFVIGGLTEERNAGENLAGPLPLVGFGCLTAPVRVLATQLLGAQVPSGCPLD